MTRARGQTRRFFLWGVSIRNSLRSNNGVSTRAAPERQSTPRGRATVPHPAHTGALRIAGRRTGATAKLGERDGAWKAALPGVANSHYIFWGVSVALDSTVEVRSGRL